MDRKIEMLKKMAQLRVISDFCSEKLINRYLEDEKGKRFVEAVLKAWKRNSYFIKTYEERLLNEWHQLQKHLKDTRYEIKKKEQPFTIDQSISFSFDDATDHYKKLKTVGNDRMLFKQLLHEANNIYDKHLYEIQEHRTYYEVLQRKSTGEIIEVFYSSCKDKRLKQMFHKMILNMHWYVIGKLSAFTNSNEAVFNIVKRIYYVDPVVV